MMEWLEILVPVALIIGAIVAGAIAYRNRQRERGDRWTETIRCPECTQRQEAEVAFLDWMPFPAYAHQCVYCQYWITESDWERV